MVLAKDGSDAGRFFNDATLSLIYDSIHRNIMEFSSVDFY